MKTEKEKMLNDELNNGANPDLRQGRFSARRLTRLLIKHPKQKNKRACHILHSTFKEPYDPFKTLRTKTS